MEREHFRAADRPPDPKDSPGGFDDVAAAFFRLLNLKRLFADRTARLCVADTRQIPPIDRAFVVAARSTAHFGDLARFSRRGPLRELAPLPVVLPSGVRQFRSTSRHFRTTGPP